MRFCTKLEFDSGLCDLHRETDLMRLWDRVRCCIARWSLRAALGLGIAAFWFTQASAQTEFRYGWTISKSDTDPFANTGSPSGEI
jgi:hypothetical protein